MLARMILTQLLPVEHKVMMLYAKNLFPSFFDITLNSCIKCKTHNQRACFQKKKQLIHAFEFLYKWKKNLLNKPGDLCQHNHEWDTLFLLHKQKFLLVLQSNALVFI